MSPQIVQLNLLGNPQLVISADSQQSQIIDLPHTRPAWLLYYLAYDGVWMSRQELAFFFHPDADEADARRYVRKLIFKAKKFPWLQGLEVEAGRLRWVVAHDVRAFRSAINRQSWYEALKLYRGDLLLGVQDWDAPSFEAWLEGERNDLLELWRYACLQYAGDLEDAGDHRAAARIAEQVLGRNAFDEMALQTSIRNRYLAGNRHAALARADRFTKRLSEELRTVPRRETLSLIHAIRDGLEIERQKTSRKFGRRRSDYQNSTYQSNNPGDRRGAGARYLSDVLNNPQGRVLKIRSHDDCTNHEVIISQRVSDADILIRSLTKLARELYDQGHRKRAKEVLELTLDEELVSSCSLATRSFLEESHLVLTSEK